MTKREQGRRDRPGASDADPAAPPAQEAPELVANEAEDCRGLPIRLELEPDGAHYTLEIPSKGTRRRYAVKGR